MSVRQMCGAQIPTWVVLSQIAHCCFAQSGDGRRILRIFATGQESDHTSGTDKGRSFHTAFLYFSQSEHANALTNYCIVSVEYRSIWNRQNNRTEWTETIMFTLHQNFLSPVKVISCCSSHNCETKTNKMLSGIAY